MLILSKCLKIRKNYLSDLLVFVSHFTTKTNCPGGGTVNDDRYQLSQSRGQRPRLLSSEVKVKLTLKMKSIKVFKEIGQNKC